MISSETNEFSVEVSGIIDSFHKNHKEIYDSEMSVSDLKELIKSKASEGLTRLYLHYSVSLADIAELNLCGINCYLLNGNVYGYKTVVM